MVEIVLEKRSRFGVWWSIHFKPETPPESLVPRGATETTSRWARSRKVALRRARCYLSKPEPSREVVRLRASDERGADASGPSRSDGGRAG